MWIHNKGGLSKAVPCGGALKTVRPETAVEVDGADIKPELTSERREFWKGHSIFFVQDDPYAKSGKGKAGKPNQGGKSGQGGASTPPAPGQSSSQGGGS